MNNSPLIGRNVKVLANDFVQNDLAANIAHVSEHYRKILLEMVPPLIVSGVTYTHAVASPRLSNDDISKLLITGALWCSITWVTENRFDQRKPLDITWWRGGAAAITDVVLD